MFAVCTAMPVSADDHRLNIVYILADDMGYGDISFYNSQSKIPTPALDSLAASGIVLLMLTVIHQLVLRQGMAH